MITVIDCRSHDVSIELHRVYAVQASFIALAKRHGAFTYVNPFSFHLEPQFDDYAAKTQSGIAQLERLCRRDHITDAVITIQQYGLTVYACPR